MNLRKTTCALVVLALAAVLLGDTSAQAGLFDGLCSWWQPPVAAPLAPAPTYTVQRVAYMPATTVAYSLPVAQTCYYQPEVRYRWTYSRVPRTSYEPIASVDPCTGAVTTAYRPVTRLSLLPWLHREPYTAYRYTCSPGYTASYTPMCASTTVCDSCDPCGGAISSAGSACAGCAPSAAAPAPGPGETAPSLQNGYGPSTFRNQPTDVQQRYKPESPTEPSGSEQNTSLPHLRLIPPTEQTAARPIELAGRTAAPHVQPIPWNVLPASAASYQAELAAPAPRQPVLDVSGWHSVAP